MPASERITIALRAPEISTLNVIRQYIKLGAPVAIGRGLAVIAGASEGDAMERAEQLESLPNIEREGAMHIDDRVKMIGREPAFLTVVFKLPSLNDAQSLIEQLPYGQKALGTEAVVFGISAGNLMGDAPCAD